MSMHEDAAILFLLDLGTGVSYRPEEQDEKVTEIQEACNVTEDRVSELHDKLDSSNVVNVRSTQFGLL